MDLEKMLTDLKRERDRLIHAIALLSGDSAASGKTGKRATKRKRRGGITPAGRRLPQRRYDDGPSESIRHREMR
jgi:hypothetical protein